MILQALLAIALLNIVYVTGFFTASLIAKVHHQHYHLGYGKALFIIHIGGVAFSIGLYVPIVGLAKIYTITDGEKKPAAYPWQFHDAALMRRLLATLGGPLALLLCGILTSIGITFSNPESIITKDEVNKHGIYPSAAALEIGLKRGDSIVAVNGQDYDKFTDLMSPQVLGSEKSYYTVLRDGKHLDVPINGGLQKSIRDREPFIWIDAPFAIDVVLHNSPADVAGVKTGDRILRVNDQAINNTFDFKKAVNADDDGMLSLDIERKHNGAVGKLTVAVEANSDKTIGVSMKELYTLTAKKYTIAESIKMGTVRAFQNVKTYAKAMKVMVFGVDPKKLSGPISIAPAFQPMFWPIVAHYAMLFACWHLLPLPKSVLWEVFPLAYEAGTRKAYPLKWFNRSLNIAWMLLFFIYISIFVSDIIRF